MIIVTAGASYIDIDAYACSVAYTELLNRIGQEAQAASTAVWNESISQSLVALRAPFNRNPTPNIHDHCVLVDVSDPLQFDSVVTTDQVIAVIDHRPGFEAYWTERLGDKCQIELVGAAATLVYECWQDSGKLNQMSTTSAELLAAAILDNTLNFEASVTTQRDKVAYAFLAQHASLDAGWAARYFLDCQTAILADLDTSLRNDTKFLQFPGLHTELCLGQMVVWNASTIINSGLDSIAMTLGDMHTSWLANIVSISEGRSYFLTDDEAVKIWLSNTLGVKFTGQLAVADRLWLRKEILGKALQSV